MRSSVSCASFGRQCLSELFFFSLLHLFSFGWLFSSLLVLCFFWLSIERMFAVVGSSSVNPVRLMLFCSSVCTSQAIVSRKRKSYKKKSITTINITRKNAPRKKRRQNNLAKEKRVCHWFEVIASLNGDEWHPKWLYTTVKPHCNRRFSFCFLPLLRFSISIALFDFMLRFRYTAISLFFEICFHLNHVY